MKNAFTLKTSWCVIFLFLSVFLFGQKEYSLSFQLKHGITGLEGNEQPDGEFGRIIRETIPGGDFSIGIKTNFFFSEEKIISGNFGILWNYYSFARIEKENVPNAFGVREEHETTFRFSSHSVNFPMSLTTRFWRIGFSVGIIPRYHLSTKVNEDAIIYSSISNNYKVESLIFEAGKMNTNIIPNMACDIDVSLEAEMDVQVF
ncbi:MAG: hypothetical protein AB8F94_20855 [Saprospiraceae bacterium]